MAWATGAHHQRDYTAAAVLAASSLPYAFIAGTGLLPADAPAGHGFGRAHFLAGAVTVLVVALAAISASAAGSRCRWQARPWVS